MLFKNTKKAVFSIILASMLTLTACGGSASVSVSKDTGSSAESSVQSNEISGVADIAAEIALTVNNGGAYTIDKELTGTVVIDTEADLKLTLKGAKINTSTGPALYVKNCGGLEIILEGENVLCDSAVYAAEHGDLKAALFSEDNVVFSGDGKLTVTGKHGHAIASDDGITVKNGSLVVESAVKDGVHANDLVDVKGGSLTVKAAGGDAIESEAVVTISGGNIDLNSSGDGIKASLNDKGTPSVTIEGGNVKINTAEDGIQSDGELTVKNGNIDITTTGAVVNNNSDNMMPGGGFRPTRPDGGNRPTRPDNMTPPEGFDPNVSMDMVPPKNNFTTPTDISADTQTSNLSSKGIKSAGLLTIEGGNINVVTTEDALHSDGDLVIEGGNITISADDDAVHAEGALTVKKGNVSINKCYEGLEGMTVTVEDGVINIAASDDGINSSDGESVNNRPGNANPNNDITINGGKIYIKAEGDCIDSNGGFTVNGGFVCVENNSRGGNNALDADGTRLINGGVVIALGNADMLESPSPSSAQPTAVIFANVSAGTTVAITDAKGKVVLCYASTVSASVITLSSPELKTGESYTLYTGVTPTGDKTVGGLYYGDGVTFTGGNEVKTFTLSSTVTNAR